MFVVKRKLTQTITFTLSDKIKALTDKLPSDPSAVDERQLSELIHTVQQIKKIIDNPIVLKVLSVSIGEIPKVAVGIEAPEQIKFTF